MFSRNKDSQSSPTQQTASDATKSGGKGRPTPTRKEAEAAAKARAKVPRTRQELAAAEKSTRRKALDGLKAGDEKFLPARDRGPIKRFIRDFVDTRFSFIEIMVPLLLVSMVLSYTTNPTLMQMGNVVLLATLAMIVVDGFALHFRLRREMQRRFPDESRSGTTRYALMRSLQMRFMRLPKARVKIGDTLPETYK